MQYNIDKSLLDELPKKIATLPDIVQMNPADLKAIFDANAEALQEKHNGLIGFLKDYSAGHSAAAEIGSEPISEISGTTVRGQIESLKGYVDNNGIAHLPSGSVGEDKLTELLQRALFHVGDYKWRPMPASVSGWLLCDGSEVSRADYTALFDCLNPSMGECAISAGSAAYVTKTAHGLRTGDGVYFTTDGALPQGISPNTRYWAIRTNADTICIALSYKNAMAGIPVEATGTQSGTHTLRRSPYGIGDGATTFNVPDIKGRAMVGVDSSAENPQVEFAAPGQADGEKAHLLTANENGVHSHSAGANTVAAHSHTASMTGAGDHSHTGSTGTTGSHYHSGSTNGAGDHAHNVSFPNYYQFHVGTGVNAFVSDSSDGPYPAGAYHDRTSSTGGGHSHSFNTGSTGDHSHSFNTSAVAAHTHTLTLDSAGGHTHTVTVQDSAGGQAHNNLQPYITGYCFIKC